MQLKTATDYAISAVVCLAANGNSMCSVDIAEKMGIPPKYLINIIVTLREHKIIASIKGAVGGYYLARDPRELTLWAVIKAMEPTMFINRCMEEDKLCSHNCVAVCPTRQVYLKAQRALEEHLNIPVADIVED
ncbi:MAG: Rrf2 family transcriptional regulator [Firmicutes bacterium]|nr:Rrf2 family transcriptional regulator [Bacillota bacterium]